MGPKKSILIKEMVELSNKINDDEIICEMCETFINVFLPEKQSQSFIKKVRGEKLNAQERRKYNKGLSTLQSYYQFFRFLEDNKEVEDVKKIIDLLED